MFHPDWLILRLLHQSFNIEIPKGHWSEVVVHLYLVSLVLFDFINLTQVHNFTVSAQDIFTFRRLSVFTASFTGILQVLMQIMNRFVPSYWLVKRL